MLDCISLFIFVSLSNKLMQAVALLICIQNVPILSFNLDSIEILVVFLCRLSTYKDNTLNKTKTAFVHFLAIHYILTILQVSVKNFLRTDSIIK